MRHLILTLEAPLMSCGGETIDNYGVIRSFPAASMLTGLLANALGWRRIEGERHQRLQDRLVFAARIDRESADGVSFVDFQTAQLDKSDKGWTTRGKPEGRAGGGRTYDAPHLRFREYFADLRFTVALRMEPAEGRPTVDDLANALERPARPLFIGRKSCLPSAPIFACFSEGETALAALLAAPLDEREAPDTVRLLWPEDDSPKVMAEVKTSRTHMLTDQRNWRSSGLHGGGRLVCEGTIESDRLPARGAAMPQTEKDEEQ